MHQWWHLSVGAAENVWGAVENGGGRGRRDLVGLSRGELFDRNGIAFEEQPQEGDQLASAEARLLGVGEPVGQSRGES